MDRDNLDDGREEVDKGREMGHWERKIVGKCKIWIKGEKSEKEEIKMETIILQSRTLVKGHSSPINTSDVRLRAIRPPLWSPHQVKVRSTMSGPLVSLWRETTAGFLCKNRIEVVVSLWQNCSVKKHQMSNVCMSKDVLGTPRRSLWWKCPCFIWSVVPLLCSRLYYQQL